MLPLVIPPREPSQEPEPAPEEENGKELFMRLKAMAIAAVPEAESKTWANTFDQKIRPGDIPVFLLRVQGYSMKDISETLGKSTTTIRRILQSPAGQELLRELYAEAGIANNDIVENFKRAAPDAVDIVIDLAHNADKDETRLKAAFSILDRAGYGVTKKQEIETKTTMTVVTTTELDAMRAALEESMELAADFEVLPAQEAPRDSSTDG